MKRELVAAFTVLLVAGCLQPPPEEVETAQTELLQRYAAAEPATAVASANATWYLASVMAAPEGGLSAFEWTVPAGARVPWGYNELFEEDQRTVVLEVALLEGEGVEAWGLLVLDDDEGGKLSAIGGILQVPVEAVAYGVGGEQTHSETPTSTGFASLGWEAEEGETLRFLGLAKGAAREVGIAFRVLDHDPSYPGSEEEPVDSPADFLAARAGAAPLGIPPRASAIGLEIHVYLDLLLGGSIPVEPSWGLELVVGEPTAEWSAPPAERALGGSHTFKGSITGALEHGFDAVDASYGSFGSTERAEYVAEVTLHGETKRAEGTALTASGLLFTPLGYASAGAVGLGDGEGATSSMLAIERTRVGGWFTIASLTLFEFGATLEELFGVASEHDLASYEDAFGARAIAAPGSLTLLRPDGSALTLPLPREAGVPTGVLGAR